MLEVSLKIRCSVRANLKVMFDKQALVLVNYAEASLADVKSTYQAVQNDVKQKFNILLEPEPVLYSALGLIQSHSG